MSWKSKINPRIHHRNMKYHFESITILYILLKSKSKETLSRNNKTNHKNLHNGINRNDEQNLKKYP